MIPPAPLRLRLDGAALVHNWQWLRDQGGTAACGAAIKADGYGLGAQGVLDRLSAAGCSDFFVATWGEAAALKLPGDARLAVLHGVRDADMAFAVDHAARPVLNSAEQVIRWRGTGRACDVMVDTGMNRLGIAAADIAGGLLDGLAVDTLMSHLACADEDSAMNARQCAALAGLAGSTGARRLSLANSAGICLGPDYAFDLTRPGLALYGGIPRREAEGHIRQVAFPEAEIVQRRRIEPGETIGYGACFTAAAPTEVAILNIGYADGYWRNFFGHGSAGAGRFPVIGRISMDLIAISVDAEPALGEGDWVAIDYALPSAAAASGMAQYELLTGLGQRFERRWD